MNYRSFILHLAFLAAFAMALSGNVSLAAEPQSISLDFYQETATQNYIQTDNPQLGYRTLGSAVATEWVITPSTTLHFTVNGNVAGGTLVLELYGRKESIWFVGGQAPPPGTLPPPAEESFGKVEIPITAALLNSGTLQHVNFQTLVDEQEVLTTGDPYTEFYFGIYVINGPRTFSEVDAYLNNVQIGAGVYDSNYRGGFNLSVLYAHPQWEVSLANITFDTSDGMAGFTNLGTQNNHPLHGALSNYRYRLQDQAVSDHIVAREWQFYQLNQNGDLVASLPGQGTAGEICEFTAQEVEFIYNPTVNWPNMLVLCRRYDDRGMVSTESYSLSNLGTDVFQYKVAYDPAAYPAMALYVGHDTDQTPPGVDPVPLSETGPTIIDPSYLYVMPYHAQLANYTGNLKYRVRYAFAGDGVVHTSPGFTDVNPINSANGQWLPYFTEIDARNNANYPVTVEWQFQTDYGTSPWSNKPSEIVLFNQPDSPDLEVDWSTTPAVLTHSQPFDLKLKAAAPGNGYQARFSLWVFNPNNLAQHAQVKTTGNVDCQFYGQWDLWQTFPSYQIPNVVNTWNLGENDRLALRVKFAWLPTGQAGVLSCNPQLGNANPLNNFYYGTSALVPNAFYAVRSSESTSVVQPAPGDFEMVLAEQMPAIYDPSGDVNFALLLQRSGEIPPQKLSWRLSNQNNQYWVNGDWITNTGSSPAFETVWPSEQVTDAFSQRWHWSTISGALEPAQRKNNQAPFPFSALANQNLIDNFFDGAMEVTLTVEMKMTFDPSDPVNGAVVRAKTFVVRPQQIDSLVLGLTTKAGGSAIEHVHTRLPNLPNLEWEIPTQSNTVGGIRVALFKKDNQAASGWQNLFCEVMDEGLAPPQSGSQYFTSFSTQMTPNQGLQYTLTASASSGLYNLIASEGAGDYQLRFSSETCSGNWGHAYASRITVNPDQSFRMRFHYRDHLGSSTVSRAYAPDSESRIVGASAYLFKLTGLSGNQQVALFAQETKASHFSPFGKTTGNADAEPDPRYTDHEYDGESGFNYMKGRYQLATWAKFNRPDPMRDWDWENPSSINLYQYVRNNPVMSWDPNGFERGMLQSSYNSDVERAKNVQQTVKKAKKEGKSTLLAVANEFPLATMAFTETLPGSDVGIIAMDVKENGASLSAAVDVVLGALPLLPNGLGRLAKKIAGAGDAAADAKKVEKGFEGKARFQVSSEGVAIPNNPDELRDNMKKLEETTTKPESRKFLGKDGKGPLRVRIEKAHPEDPNFKGKPDPLHTVDHLHIDRRKNVETGQWKSKEKVAYEFPYKEKK